MAEKKKTNAYLLSIVGIVAVVGTIIMILNAGQYSLGQFGTTDIAGQAVTKKECRMYCFDDIDTNCFDDDDNFVGFTKGSFDAAKECATKVWHDTRRSSYCDENGDWGTGTLTGKMENLCGSYDYGTVFWGTHLAFYGGQTGSGTWSFYS